MLSPLLLAVDPAYAVSALCLVAVQLAISFWRLVELQQRRKKQQQQQCPEHAHSNHHVRPTTISPVIPFFGHIIHFFRRGHEYFSNLCLSTSLPVFILNMGPTSLVVVQPEMRTHLPKTQHLRLHPMVAAFFGRSLDFGKNTCALMREELPGSERMAPMISRVFREELVSTPSLRRYTEQLDRHTTREIAAITPADGQSTTFFLSDWIFAAVVGPLGRALWNDSDDDEHGESQVRSPFRDAEFLRHFKSIMQNMSLLNRPLTSLFQRDLVASRNFVRDAFRHSAAEATYRSDSLLARLKATCLAHGALPDDWTDFQLLLAEGAAPNIVAALTWMIHHLVADPTWLAEVRSEIDTLVHSGQPIPMRDTVEKCPKLMATWLETLRRHGSFSIARLAAEDTVMADQWTVKKGAIVMAPLRPYHVDPQTWGEETDKFVPQRFLKADGSLDEIRRRRLRMYGLFGSMCPGRHLAVYEAMSLIIRLLSAVDICTADGRPHIVPDESTDNVAGLSCPIKDLEVTLRPRSPRLPDVHISYHEPGR